MLQRPASVLPALVGAAVGFAVLWIAKALGAPVVFPFPPAWSSGSAWPPGMIRDLEFFLGTAISAALVTGWITWRLEARYGEDWMDTHAVAIVLAIVVVAVLVLYVWPIVAHLL